MFNLTARSFDGGGFSDDQLGWKAEMLNGSVWIENLFNKNFTGGVSQLEFWRVDGGDGGRRNQRIIDVVITDNH